MLELNWPFFLIAGPAVMFAGISKGGFGSGAAFAAASMLAIVIDPGQALGVMLPLLMLIDAVTMRSYWRKWNASAARLLILGRLPGIVLGGAFYTVASPDLFRLLIGGIALAFVAWQVLGKRGLIRTSARPLPEWAGLLSGLVAGFTSYVSHAGGPPAAVYLLSLRLGKTEFQATTVLVFWTINIAKFVPYAILGLFTMQTFLANLVLAPFALVGAWLGVLAHRLIPEQIFFGVTYVLLSVTGAKLIWDGMS